MAIYRLLKKEIPGPFVGRVNILEKENSRYLGVIFFIKGKIVGVEFDNMKGKNALFYFFNQLEDRAIDVQFVIEPEVLSKENIQFEVFPGVFFDEFEKYKKSLKKIIDLRPPDHLVLKANPDFIKKGTLLSEEEFTLLETIMSCRNVGEVFAHSSFEEYLTNVLLVSLRKKKAVLVLA